MTQPTSRDVKCPYCLREFELKSIGDRHNKNLKDAFDAAENGETINLSSLIGGKEQLDFGQTDKPLASDDWRIEEPEPEVTVDHQADDLKAALKEPFTLRQFAQRSQDRHNAGL